MFDILQDGIQNRHKLLNVKFKLLKNDYTGHYPYPQIGTVRWRITLFSSFTWKVEKHDFTLLYNLLFKILLSAFYKLKPIDVHLRTLVVPKTFRGGCLLMKSQLLFTKPMYKSWLLENRVKQYRFLKLNYLQYCSLTRKISSHMLYQAQFPLSIRKTYQHWG